MKNILKKLALLAIPVLLWLAFFIAFEPNNYFGLKASATSSQPVARVRAYQQDPGTNLILGDSRLAHFDMGLVDSLSGQSWQNLAFGGASLKETLDLADYLLDSGHDADTLLVEVSFYTLNAGYNTDRFATLEETLNNPLAYCFNLEYNVNALTVAMDTLRGTPDTIESGDWVAADYLADDGTVLPLHRKLYDYTATITPRCKSWALNDEQFNRLHTLALIVKGLLPAEVLGAPVTFMTYTATIMNIGILGLDQALLRFYHEPPAGAEPRQLFAACTRISAAFMMLLGTAGSVFFAQPLAAAFGLGSAGPGIVPLLFLNAALYMLVRYLNVLLRLENDLRAYTAETLWMQGCYNLFYLLPGFFTSNVFVLAVAAILSFGVVAIAFGYKYRAAVFAPLPGAQLGGIARQTVPYGVALAPAQILFSLSSGICLSFVGNASGENAQGLFAFGYSLAQLVTAIQAGFSTYWGPYVYSHYRDEQERICRVHDVLNLLIFGFFCVLVMFEDIVFVIFPDKRGCLAIFPLLMLAVVFNILCEGTVYGNSIARKPWHDTIGIGLGALSNFGLCALLVPAFGLTGAALALAASNGLAFLYRSITGQMYYRTVASYPKTISGFLLAFAVTAIGTLLWQHFFIKFALVGVILFIYCTLYRAQLARLWSMGLGILRGIFHRK